MRRRHFDPVSDCYFSLGLALAAKGWDARDVVSQDSFSKGLGTLLTELKVALTNRGVQNASAQHDFEGAVPRAVTYTVAVDALTVTETFSREEIEDSAIAIDAPAALKVRMLVSHFVR